MSISNHKIHSQCGYKLVLAFSLESDKLWEFQILSMSIQFLLPKLCDVINQKFARLFAVQWLSIKISSVESAVGGGVLLHNLKVKW